MALKQTINRLQPLFYNSIRQYASAEKFVDAKVNEKTGITTITMQRPPVNSLNTALLSQLLQNLQDLQGTKTRGVILTSSNPTVFSAGLDLMELYKPTEEGFTKLWTILQDIWLALYGADYPTVAAINGHSPAGGCVLSMCCEYRVMLSKYTIGLNETLVGIAAPTMVQEQMRNIIGARQAELALTTGRIFTTEEALKIGLVDEVATDKNDLMAKAESYLMRFAKISPAARNMTKVSFRRREIEDFAKTRDQDLQMILAFVTQPDVQKRFGKYIEMLKKKQTA